MYLKCNFIKIIYIKCIWYQEEQAVMQLLLLKTKVVQGSLKQPFLPSPSSIPFCSIYSSFLFGLLWLQFSYRLPSPPLSLSTSVHSPFHPFTPPACVPSSHQCLRGRCWQQAGMLSGLLCRIVRLHCAWEDKRGQGRSITSPPSTLIGLRTGVRACSWAVGPARPICL